MTLLLVADIFAKNSLRFIHGKMNMRINWRDGCWLRRRQKQAEILSGLCVPVILGSAQAPGRGGGIVRLGSNKGIEKWNCEP